MIEPEIAFADLSDNAALAEALLKYTFAALLDERQQDLAFFDQRIEKGLVRNSRASSVPNLCIWITARRSRCSRGRTRNSEFPVKWGIGLQSEDERYLTEKHAKQPVIVMNYPKATKAFYMRLK